MCCMRPAFSSLRLWLWSTSWPRSSSTKVLEIANATWDWLKGVASEWLPAVSALRTKKKVGSRCSACCGVQPASFLETASADTGGRLACMDCTLQNGTDWRRVAGIPSLSTLGLQLFCSYYFLRLTGAFSSSSFPLSCSQSSQLPVFPIHLCGFNASS